MEQSKTYVPKSRAKAKQTKIGQVLRLGFHAKTLSDFSNQHANQAGYINLDVVPRREPDQYGNTHSVVLNDWKPDASKSNPASPQDDVPKTKVPF
ncbi:MAG: hypothetical protein KGL39_10315 [Patescibacteria group bacterium]|nr:hypothetical protein [Patescibacteria group bacterium]